MKKRIVSLLLTVLMVASVMVLPASALQPGDKLGDVLYTNIVAYIDGYPLRSYNIAGNTYVVVEDLMNYGFGVIWDPTGTGRLVISPERTAAPAHYTATFRPSANTGVPGMPAMDYVYTNITTWIGDQQITGYNINGATIVCMDDIAARFAATYAFAAAENALYMTSPAFVQTPVEPETPVVPEPPVEPEQPIDPVEPVDPVLPVDPAQLLPEQAVEAYIAEYTQVLLTREFTGAAGEALAKLKADYGEELFEGYLQLLTNIFSTMSYTFTGTTVSGTMATVGLSVTSTDMSTVMSEFTAAMFSQMNKLSHATGAKRNAILMEILLDVINAKVRPMKTVQTALELELVDGVWTVDLEKNTAFLNAITSGLYSTAMTYLK